MNALKPLDNFPLTRSADPEEVRAALAKVYAEPTLELGRGARKLNGRINECRLQSIRLAYGAYGVDTCFNFPAVDCFMQIVPLRGRGEVTSRRQPVSLAAGGLTATISPDAGYLGKYSHDYEGLLLKLDRRALKRKLSAMTGVVIDQPLKMDLQDNNGTQSAQTLHQYLRVLATMLNDARPPLPAWWVSQTEQLLMVMFLCGHRHNYSHLLEQEAADPAPWQVRKAEDYIEANWQEPVTLETLAEVTGVSGFSLFRAFRRIRGYSPFEFALRQIL
ncbi:MAG: AraC family transcriptional regulator [Pseudolabrys sp.]